MWSEASSSTIVSVWFGHVPVVLSFFLIDPARGPGGRMVSGQLSSDNGIHIMLSSDIMTIMTRPPRKAKSTT